MKRNLHFVCEFVLLTACSAGPTGGPTDSSGAAEGGNKQEGDTIKIGANLELSGAVAAYGTAEKRDRLGSRRNQCCRRRSWKTN